MSIACILVGVWFSGNTVRAQGIDTLDKVITNVGNYLLYRNHDTNYIRSYSKDISIRLVAVNKFNYFRLIDRRNNTSIRYRPARDINLGIGMSYKFFALDITLSLGLRKNTEFESERSFDFQGRLFSSKQFITARLQFYQGYKVSNILGAQVSENDVNQIREDIRSISLGLQYLHALNYTKFSIKAPFVFNEVQRKSAGSIIFGAGFSLFVMDSDSSIVPTQVLNDFDTNMQIKSLSDINLAISAGYMYTFVFWKKFFVTASLIPGISLNAGDYVTDIRRPIDLTLNFRLNTMNSIGYNSRRWYTGFQYIADVGITRIVKKMSMNIGSGKLNLYLGYRFSVGKKKNKKKKSSGLE